MRVDFRQIRMRIMPPCRLEAAARRNSPLSAASRAASAAAGTSVGASFTASTPSARAAAALDVGGAKGARSQQHGTVASLDLVLSIRP